MTNTNLKVETTSGGTWVECLRCGRGSLFEKGPILHSKHCPTVDKTRKANDMRPNGAQLERK